MDQLVHMGFALRHFDLEEMDGTTVTKFGEHYRYGYFDMILHNNQTTSYWGLYSTGAFNALTGPIAFMVSAISLVYLF